jgi:hypothetical protein
MRCDICFQEKPTYKDANPMVMGYWAKGALVKGSTTFNTCDSCSRCFYDNKDLLKSLFSLLNYDFRTKKNINDL